MDHVNGSEAQAPQGHDLATFRDGRDELNLCEFPLAAVADRYIDGRKTVVFTGEAWNPEQKKHVPRTLTVSGSDRYGLPTAKDDDVLLACVQLSKLNEFQNRELHFSRYQILKLLRWPQQTYNYRRVKVALRRLLGLSIYSERAFWDKSRSSWVSKDFGVIDNLYLYERDQQDGSHAHEDSWLVWNEVLWNSFQAGYIKKLDWDLYCRLKSPISKRLLRFLGKRFYHQREWTFDLHELAVQRVRMSEGQPTGEIKRQLKAAIAELESQWELEPMNEKQRFRRVARGKWEVVFRRAAKRANQPRGTAPTVTGEEKRLIERGVVAKVAARLVSRYDAAKTRKMIDLFDWYSQQGQKKAPGFLVASIQAEEPYTIPRGASRDVMSSCIDREPVRPSGPMRTTPHNGAAAGRAKLNLREERDVAADHHLDQLGAAELAKLEIAALRTADRMLLDGYQRNKAEGGAIFESYRRSILRQYLRRTADEADSGDVTTADAEGT